MIYNLVSFDVFAIIFFKF